MDSSIDGVKVLMRQSVPQCPTSEHCFRDQALTTHDPLGYWTAISLITWKGNLFLFFQLLVAYCSLWLSLVVLDLKLLLSVFLMLALPWLDVVVGSFWYPRMTLFHDP